MTAEGDPTQPNWATNPGYIAITIIGIFTVLGFFLGLGMKDPGVLKDSFWIGMGFTIVYLLLVVANNLERLESDS